MRTLPEYYPADNVYTWFPLMRPDKMAGFLKEIGDLELYDTSKPQLVKTALGVDEYQYAGQVLGNEESFRSISSSRATRVIQGKGLVGFSSLLDVADELSVDSTSHLRIPPGHARSNRL